MKIVPKAATVKNPPEQFTGDGWVDSLATPQQPGQRMVAGRVWFAPGARTAWHSHLAMLENADDRATTTAWLEHVTDDDYRIPQEA